MFECVTLFPYYITYAFLLILLFILLNGSQVVLSLYQTLLTETLLVKVMGLCRVIGKNVLSKKTAMTTCSMWPYSLTHTG